MPGLMRGDAEPKNREAMRPADYQDLHGVCCISKTVHVLWDVCGAVAIAQHPAAQTLPPWPQHDHSTTASAHGTTVARLSDPFLYCWGAGIHVIGWDSKNSFIACKLQ